jgi:hypothetical protein
MVTAVPGVRRTAKQLVDGTWRLTVDIEPRHGKDFLHLLGEVDMPVALAPLVPDYQREGSSPETSEGGVAGATNPGGNWKNLGPLAQSAVMICKDADFQRYAAEMQGIEDDPEAVDLEALAARHVKEQCHVSSRKDLDTADGAKSRYGALMSHFREWQR